MSVKVVSPCKHQATAEIIPTSCSTCSEVIPCTAQQSLWVSVRCHFSWQLPNNLSCAALQLQIKHTAYLTCFKTFFLSSCFANGLAMRDVVWKQFANRGHAAGALSVFGVAVFELQPALNWSPDHGTLNLKTTRVASPGWRLMVVGLTGFAFEWFLELRESIVRAGADQSDCERCL